MKALGIIIVFWFMTISLGLIFFAKGGHWESNELVKQEFTVSRPEIIAVIPHDASCYTQGLLFNNQDGFLYESCGRYYQSMLRRVDPKTGEVLLSVPVNPMLFAEGIWIVKNDLLMLTWKKKQLLVYDWRSLTLRSTHSFKTTTTEGWGITGNSTTLMVTDGSHWLHFWDIDEYTLSPTGSKIPVTQENPNATSTIVRYLNEVELVSSTELLANVYQRDVIVRIDVRTGVLMGLYNFSDILISQLIL
jgi:glutamine cyclotransferase